MQLELDHVPFAWRDLDAITGEFERLGLPSEYGGVHDNGATHMSVVGFEDRSYIELIAEHTSADHGFWPAHIRADAGPAAWAIRVDDIIAACRHVLNHGRTVRGPLYGSRERDDGTLVEWDRAEFGDEDRRLVLPFAIADRTPRSYRITPTEELRDGPLTGIGQVVILVDVFDQWVRLFRDLYRMPQPVRRTVDGLGTIASFPGRPVAMTTPDEPWLADRLEAFPPGPCSVLLRTTDLDAAMAEYPLRDPQPWPDGRVAFFDSDVLGYRLGVIERA